MFATDAPINVEEVLDGLSFPASKMQIIAYADDNDASEEAMEMLRAIPAKNYESMKAINKNLGLIEKQPGSENLWSSNA